MKLFDDILLLVVLTICKKRMQQYILGLLRWSHFSGKPPASKVPEVNHSREPLGLRTIKDFFFVLELS